MRTLVTVLAVAVVLGTVPIATAQSSNTLVAEGLALPKDHQYERYNAESGSYGKVDVSQVPALVHQKQPVYDRTAKAWVYQSGKGLDPRYAAPATSSPAPSAPAASAPAASTPAATPAPNAPLVAEGLTLPKDHQYERYNAGAATYGRVDVNQVPGLVRQKVPIYDRTAKAWVNNTEQKVDPRYMAAAPAAAPPAAASPTSTLPAGAAAGLPKDHQYQRYDKGSAAYTRVDVSEVPALVQQKVPIYDRTAKAWVLNTEGQVDPRYAAAFPGMASSSSTPPVLANLSLPKDHQYERYDLASGTYSRVDMSQVPTLVQNKVPVYDRTAKDWVYSTDLQLNPRYAPGAPRTTK